MSYSFREGITTVKELASEIKAACDAYKRREITSDALKGHILRYAHLYPDMMFEGNGYNPTVKKIVGQRRIILMDVSLEGFQKSFL